MKLKFGSIFLQILSEIVANPFGFFEKKRGALFIIIQIKKKTIFDKKFIIFEEFVLYRRLHHNFIFAVNLT